MPFSPLSFLLGLGLGWAAPIVARSSRALAVELAVAGMTMLDEARRVLAEQVEAIEDIAAEARARREELAARADADGQIDEEQDGGEEGTGEADAGEADAEVEAAGRGRRRAGARRAAPTSNGAR